ncbi:MAG: DUF3306 domain-containing protein [Granulosicoccus sp.]|nr:DUF3306 domain-containing protein [Granulosicoccus sp.]
MSTDRENGFLTRWSNRKQANKVAQDEINSDSIVQGDSDSRTADDHDDSELAVDTTSPAPADQSAAQADSEEPLLSDDDMPAIETLTATSDISGFLNKGVSSALRRAALRHVFAQPQYNVRDGLNDYDGDYTVFEPLGDTVTADMRYHAARKERERLEKLEAQRAEEAKLADNTVSEQTPDQTTDQANDQANDQATNQQNDQLEHSDEEPVENRPQGNALDAATDSETGRDETEGQHEATAERNTEPHPPNSSDDAQPIVPKDSEVHT